MDKYKVVRFFSYYALHGNYIKVEIVGSSPNCKEQGQLKSKQHQAQKKMGKPRERRIDSTMMVCNNYNGILFGVI